VDCTDALNRLVIKDKEGCFMRIQVYPSSNKDEILFSGDSIIVRVTSPPRGGKANENVVKLFKKKMKVRVTIESGFKSRDKTLKIPYPDCQELIKKICEV
jgi:uncharacterized protein (TIGR00251 family)